MERTAEDVLTFLAEHGGQIFALLARLTLRNDVAEDLMQELFCNLSRSKGFRRAADPYSYAFARRRTWHSPTGASRRSLPGTMTRDPIESVAGRGHSPLVDLVMQEELDQVLDCIGRLPRATRSIVVARYLERERYETIADRMGKTPHQVRDLSQGNCAFAADAGRRAGTPGLRARGGVT